jgi:indole-3-glycerol phosphate synthase
MRDVLAEICDRKRAHVAKQKSLKSLNELEAQSRSAPATRGFLKALKQKDAAGKFPVITEIKKASPSAGVIREDFNPKTLAAAYQQAGAACLSVLTDNPYFQGDDTDILKAREACSLPVLRKDFMLDTYQVTEARALGADCILIILAAVDDVLASEMEDAAFGLGMDVLIETHDAFEFERALKLQSPLIGINNRDLKTLQVELQTTLDLAKNAPQDRVVISESGISSNDDLKNLWLGGARGFLVGERLMRQDNVMRAAAELIGMGR